MPSNHATHSDPDYVSPYMDPPVESPFKRPERRMRDPTERLSLDPSTRGALGFGSAFFVGSALGLSHGGQTAGLRFRAENAHRLPTSQKGWYFYHKSKNYHTLLGGVKEGARMGAKLGFWVAAFMTMEEAVDEWRGGGKNRDFLSTVAAGLTTSGAFSLWNQFPMTTAARTAKTGLRIGLGYGLLQDAFSLLQGRKIGYVEFIKRFLPGERGDTDPDAVHQEQST
jgi:hypothetical protein